jgi:hypothetical protein
MLAKDRAGSGAVSAGSTRRRERQLCEANAGRRPHGVGHRRERRDDRHFATPRTPYPKNPQLAMWKNEVSAASQEVTMRWIG